MLDSQQFVIDPRKKLNLQSRPTTFDTVTPKPARGSLKTLLNQKVSSIQRWQELLFAENRQSLLVVLQGMDTSGKDSTIKHVCTGVNPQGLRVFSFGVPTTAEFEDGYLHRYWNKFPSRGFIHVFNRSYYEEITEVRVHPHLLEKRGLNPADAGLAFWQQRIDDINALEEHLTSNGTRVLKIFLHISQDEQLKRLHRRLNDPKRHWKFEPSDLLDREFWDAYLEAHAIAIRATASVEAPWYVIPADNKPVARVLVADALASKLAFMAPAIPELTQDQLKIIQCYRQKVAIERQS